MLNGIASERFGYRFTVIAALTWITGFIGLTAFGDTIVRLLISEIGMGLGWGVFQTCRCCAYGIRPSAMHPDTISSPFLFFVFRFFRRAVTVTYATEVCPVALRSYLACYVNCCWGIGQLIGIGVVKSMLGREGDWAWRLPFALQWMWPVPLAIGVFFAPESPWWLVRKSRIEDAKRSLLRLTSTKSGQDFNADETVAMMVHTAEIESRVSTRSGCNRWADPVCIDPRRRYDQLTSGTSYLDCFKGVDRRRTEVRLWSDTCWCSDF
jgi:SP family general alpha glucoside:H+ symporter-like MFS transporter